MAWICASSACKRETCILVDGHTTSNINYDGVYPDLEVHPRSGMPKHCADDLVWGDVKHDCQKGVEIH